MGNWVLMGMAMGRDGIGVLLWASSVGVGSEGLL